MNDENRMNTIADTLAQYIRDFHELKAEVLLLRVQVDELRRARVTALEDMVAPIAMMAGAADATMTTHHYGDPSTHKVADYGLTDRIDELKALRNRCVLVPYSPDSIVSVHIMPQGDAETDADHVTDASAKADDRLRADGSLIGRRMLHLLLDFVSLGQIKKNELPELYDLAVDWAVTAYSESQYDDWYDAQLARQRAEDDESND